MFGENSHKNSSRKPLYCISIKLELSSDPKSQVTLDKLIRLLLQLLTQKCKEVLDDAKEHEPQLGFEQEYTSSQTMMVCSLPGSTLYKYSYFTFYSKYCFLIG